MTIFSALPDSATEHGPGKDAERFTSWNGMNTVKETFLSLPTKKKLTTGEVVPIGGSISTCNNGLKKAIDDE